ncbi:MAG TPA: hypothetical protein VOB72_08230 [Candidatus Dormibacteraeota bacterium]|nr:hypothetical protein [Candidatus Dormibacteraeota bacterium]
MMPLFGRKPRPTTDSPEIVPGFDRPTPTPRDVVERSIKALDAVLAAAAGQPGKNWELLDRILDERLALRHTQPLRPSVPVVQGGAA